MLVPVRDLVARVEDPADQRLVAERDEPLGPVMGLAQAASACAASYRKFAAPAPPLPNQ
jgi:hypothetical protein